MTHGFGKTASGIEVPLRKGIQCGYCPRVIFKEHEPHGKLKLVDGRPMCPVCRVTKLDKAGRFITSGGERRRYDRDVIERDKLAEQLEKQRVEDIAATSVERSGTQNKTLRKQKGLN